MWRFCETNLFLSGLHQMHGFKCGFANGKRPFFCCLATHDDLSRISKAGVCKERTHAQYSKACMAINFASITRKAELQKKYGIVAVSPFCRVSNFDVIAQTGLDIMHVLLEGKYFLFPYFWSVCCLFVGVCQRELRLLFKYIHELKYCSLSFLAATIRTFQYGHGESAPSSNFDIHIEKQEVISFHFFL